MRAEITVLLPEPEPMAAFMMLYYDIQLRRPLRCAKDQVRVNEVDKKSLSEDYIRFELTHFCDNRKECDAIGVMTVEGWRYTKPRPRERYILTLEDSTRKSRRQFAADLAKTQRILTSRGAEVSVDVE